MELRKYLKKQNKTTPSQHKLEDDGRKMELCGVLEICAFQNQLTIWLSVVIWVFGT